MLWQFIGHQPAAGRAAEHAARVWGNFCSVRPKSCCHLARDHSVGSVSFALWYKQEGPCFEIWKVAALCLRKVLAFCLGEAAGRGGKRHERAFQHLGMFECLYNSQKSERHIMKPRELHRDLLNLDCNLSPQNLGEQE